MKKKIGISFLLVILLVACTFVNVMAATSPPPIIKITGPKDTIVITDKDVVSHTSTYTTRDQRSYWKDVEIYAHHEKYNPTWNDWPQTAWFTELYGNTTARGTLYLQGFRRVGEVAWYVRYSGYLYYYD